MYLQGPLSLPRLSGIVWCVSTTHTFLSDLLSDLLRCLCWRERHNIIPLMRWNYSLFSCVLHGWVPKHLIPLVSLFLYTISSFAPLSLCSCFLGLLIPPGPRCIPPLALTPSLHPKINNLCTKACQLFVQKEFWMPFRPGSPRGGKLTNLVLFHDPPPPCFSFFLVGAALFFLFSRLSHDFIPL